MLAIGPSLMLPTRQILNPYLFGRIDSAPSDLRHALEPTIFRGVLQILSRLLQIGRQKKKSKCVRTQKSYRTFSSLTSRFRPIAKSDG